MLWIARDEEFAGESSYFLFPYQPEKIGGVWGDNVRGVDWRLPVEESPVKLEPGGGPRKVKLVLDE